MHSLKRRAVIKWFPLCAQLHKFTLHLQGLTNKMKRHTKKNNLKGPHVGLADQM